MEMNLFEGELYDFDELLDVLGAEPCEDEVTGFCPTCGHPLEGIATYKLDDGTHVCQEERCICDYYDVELVELYGMDDYDERMLEYNGVRL
jgi:hypothetical protein